MGERDKQRAISAGVIMLVLVFMIWLLTIWPARQQAQMGERAGSERVSMVRGEDACPMMNGTNSEMPPALRDLKPGRRAPDYVPTLSRQGSVLEYRTDGNNAVVRWEDAESHRYNIWMQSNPQTQQVEEIEITCGMPEEANIPAGAKR